MKKSVIFKLKEFSTPSETFVVNNIVRAIESGYTVQIICDKKHPASHSSQAEVVDSYNLLDKTIVLSEQKVSILALFDPTIAYFFFKFCLLKKKISFEYLQILKSYYPYRKKPLFHVHFGTSLQPLYYLKKIGFLRSRIMVTFHGYDAHYLTDKYISPQWIDFYNEQVFKITVNSAYTRDMLLAKGIESSKIVIVPIGVDSDYFKPSKQPKASQMLQMISVARLIPLKGIDLGLQVLKKLVSHGLAVHYTVVGDGSELENLKAMCSNLELTPYVHFKGVQNQEQIKELLNQSDLFLMTSTKDDHGRREAFGLVSLEAQAMGVPVIGFKSGGFPETLRNGETGNVVDDGDTEAMAQKIIELTKDPSLLARMSSAARKHVITNFNTKKTTNRYIEQYNSIDK